VVLANGTISSINYESHPDLYWALRGGGNNFGIVTRFDVETYPADPVWGGVSYHVLDTADHYKRLNIQRPFSLSLTYLTQTVGRIGARIICLVGKCTTLLSIIEVIEKMSKEVDESKDFLQLLVSFAYVPQFDLYLVVPTNVNKGPDVDPLSFKDFSALKTVHATTKVQNLTDVMKEGDPFNPYGLR